ncbi:MAG: hypothetical protein IH991_14920, partial [Planctomycetes bacterium]|nr:hypothetical protein [Planctomycetota bacterium]
MNVSTKPLIVFLMILSGLGSNALAFEFSEQFKQLIDQFSLDRVQKSGAIFDTGKLDWLQGQW